MINPLVPVYVGMHTKGKLEGLQSISTSSFMNSFCKAMHDEQNAICHWCYSSRYQAYRKSLREVLEKNFEFLTKTELTDVEASAIPITSIYCRIESFGEVANDIQAENYIRIIKTHPLVKFGIWTKRPLTYIRAMKKLGGKPDNCTLVFSSHFINCISKPFNWESGFIDHVFTVFDKEHAEDANINCGSKKCMDCLMCYTKGDPFFINEILK